VPQTVIGAGFVPTRGTTPARSTTGRSYGAAVVGAAAADVVVAAVFMGAVGIDPMSEIGSSPLAVRTSKLPPALLSTPVAVVALTCMVQAPATPKGMPPSDPESATPAPLSGIV
jgi:hypothetical protein